MIKDNSGIGVDDIKMYVTADKKTLKYVRDFSFGNGGKLSFDKNVYPALKALFEAFYKANSHAITLRQAATTATAKQ